MTRVAHLCAPLEARAQAFSPRHIQLGVIAGTFEWRQRARHLANDLRVCAPLPTMDGNAQRDRPPGAAGVAVASFRSLPQHGGEASGLTPACLLSNPCNRWLVREFFFFLPSPSCSPYAVSYNRRSFLRGRTLSPSIPLFFYFRAGSLYERHALLAFKFRFEDGYGSFPSPRGRSVTPHSAAGGCAPGTKYARINANKRKKQSSAAVCGGR
ncbi:hypothetical protein MTO96_032201 [Rhipicephalus appendiculatus]